MTTSSVLNPFPGKHLSSLTETQLFDISERAVNKVKKRLHVNHYSERLRALNNPIGEQHLLKCAKAIYPIHSLSLMSNNCVSVNDDRCFPGNGFKTELVAIYSCHGHVRQCGILKIVTASQVDRLPDFIRCVGVSRSLSYDVFPPTQLCAPDSAQSTCYRHIQPWLYMSSDCTCTCAV